MADQPLVDRDDLSIYWDNHLRVAFETSAPHDLPAMVEASLAHVVMLGERGALSPERSRTLLRGLLELWRQIGSGERQRSWQPRVGSYDFDGSVEDPYYYLEQQLAKACGISTDDLDVQLARSRNDLDAGVFRMILRRGILEVAELLVQTANDVLDASDRTRQDLVIGHTHRRPAQPTTIGHVLSGLAQTLLSQAAELVGVYDEMNVSPLGSAAFTGTDIDIDADRLAELLGFDSAFTASYEAVAGAEHFMRLGAAYGRVTATGARWARVLQEWMNFGWVATPASFSQGSSIMPQKQNPVVLEHMVSMAGASNGDMLATYTTIAAGWYEDSNNATTDVQKHLWHATDLVVRFLRLYDGVIRELEVKDLPDDLDVVRSGATTTAVAEALAQQQVPWRAAHGVVGKLFRAGDPTTWQESQVSAALQEVGVEVTPALVELVMSAGREPRRVLQRRQPGSPGVEAVGLANAGSRARCAELTRAFRQRRDQIDAARDGLVSLAQARVSDDTTAGSGEPRLTVVGNANLDVIVHGATQLPAPGREHVVPDVEVRLGGSAAISAVRAALRGVRTDLVSRVGTDPTTEVLHALLTTDGLDLHLVRDESAPSAVTVALESPERDRSFWSSLGALAHLGPDDVPAELLARDAVLFSGYHLLPELQGQQLADLLRTARDGGALTALDTGDPCQGWTSETRRDLLELVLPHVSIFLPNEAELSGLAGVDDPEQAARSIAEQTGCRVVAKLGARGALVVDGAEVSRHCAPAVNPVDT
ncbi:MAG TPA: hypothetical protein IAA98_04500, partial [Candidatus Avipropionibacterium avicola]|nr:hypothetical protein [Candidatus Avipropionibacterium avicola]